MKIAIVAPSPVPFEVGGAEKLWWGLQNYLNQQTVHQCELLKYPTKENSFWSLISAYQFYSELDLSHFDMLITGKYPCWMINHPNHHLYMLHCLRGLYDTYHFMNLADDVISDHPAVIKILTMMTNLNVLLADFFNAVHELRERNDLPADLFNFPGPFIRKIVHYLDKHGMQRIKKFFAISETVAKRLDYFPTNATIKVCYPPSNLTNFYCGSNSYFLSVSRLDGPKRIRMVVEAYLQTKTSIPLKIAGTGPLENELRELAKIDRRIEFLGFVSDRELVQYYADAYAIIFVPYDEDYGLTTIEAMMSGKPVLTFTDSGGVREFVKDGISGLVCEPDSHKLAKNIDRISNDRILAAQLGVDVVKRVSAITWANCANILLQQDDTNANPRIKKITVVTTYPIYPPRGGGQNRIFYLYRELAKSITIEIVSLAHEDVPPSTLEIAPNLWEIRVPKSKEHARKEWLIEEKVGIPVTDIAMLYLYQETTEFVESVKKSIRDSDYVICTQPYPYPLVKSISNKPIIHDSQNVESILKRQMLPDTPEALKLVEKVFDTEKKACLECLATTVCTMDDGQTMNELYDLDLCKIFEVSNGVDPESVTFTSFRERNELKEKVSLKGVQIVLFIGSWHQPNIDAIKEIFKIAESLSTSHFIILGSAGDFFKNNPNPRNVGFTGTVDDDEKGVWLNIADIALNPMLSGSGTNLKMLDYSLAGIPVISTKVGARGLNFPKGAIVECDIEEFSHYIKIIDTVTNTALAYDHVKTNFTWKRIGNQLQKFFTEKIL